MCIRDRLCPPVCPGQTQRFGMFEAAGRARCCCSAAAQPAAVGIPNLRARAHRNDERELRGQFNRSAVGR
eukprot:8241401-Alexandrium_andersonii.AAC.1